MRPGRDTMYAAFSSTRRSTIARGVATVSTTVARTCELLAAGNATSARRSDEKNFMSDEAA